MKTLAIVALAITGFTLAPTASAHDHGFKFEKHNHNHSFYCTPTYVCTKEICRTTQCRYAYDHCGHKYIYHVTVVTYANYFSDGSYTTFQKSYRA
ncbi:hypothetical protein [Roseimicrobium sp. ORNL1]|uniref:hypothetical protein n=1 Tax=Roseimicrobium sp. ORNL1 TaxID=2711231 RepID=UPI0013E1CD7B|nr:hypothetical protein [Roseimicrobium sp. ORNL1]QIF04805.1 hypothetical protein G5S37_25915 [Roseimicrobium sp. ORNL1]